MDNEKLMKRLQAGARSYDDANNLHAECYGTIGALEQENATLRKGIKTVRILIDESHGVAGLHLNGEIAAWDTLELGGWAEEWLIDFNESEIALALHKEGES